MKERAAVKAVMKISMASDLAERVHRAWGESPFYQSKLKGPAPDRFLHRPDDPYTPDRAQGLSLAKGRIEAGRETLDCEGELNRAFDTAPRGGALHDFLHGFQWLRPLATLGAEGRDPAMTLARAWFAAHEKWSSESWTAGLTADRLSALCCHGDLILPQGDAPWRSRVLTSMARQTRHLAHTGHRADGADDRLNAALSLCLAGSCLPACSEALERGFEILRRELRLQMRIDGGHISRNPSRQLEIVVRLRMIVAALDANKRATPGFLSHLLGRARAHLDLFRLGDGRLALFNGASEGDGRALAAALQRSGGEEAPTGFAKRSGFQRLEAARTVLVADVGAAAGEVTAQEEYDGLGSFHLASGKCRIVVNCGAGDHLSGGWGEALRLAAAHSTISSETLGPLKGAAAGHRRAEDNDGQLLELERPLIGPIGGAFNPSHATLSQPARGRQPPRGRQRARIDSAAQRAGGARHRRRFYLEASGGDLRGRDELIGVSKALAADWRLRFHLHPGVKASLARDGRSVLLALPNREGWRFRSNCKALSIEKSLYVGAGGEPTPSEQIVLSGDGLDLDGPSDIVVKWGFQRISDA
ncbi:MAG: heparinase II/III family protein [Pseudomonadota bacterium]